MSDVQELRMTAILELRIPGLSLGSVRLLQRRPAGHARAHVKGHGFPLTGSETVDSAISFVARLMVATPFTEAICSALGLDDRTNSERTLTTRRQTFMADGSSTLTLDGRPNAVPPLVEPAEYLELAMWRLSRLRLPDGAGTKALQS